MLVATFNSTSEWGSSVYIWEMSMSEMISEDWKIGGPQRSLSDLNKVRDFVKPQFGDKEHKRDILISRLEDEGVSYYVEYDSNNKLAVRAPSKAKKMPGILSIAIVTHRETDIRVLKQKVFVSEEWLKEHAGEKIKTTGWGINWVFPELVASHGTAITNVGAHEVESYIKNNKSKFTDGSHDGILLAKESSFSQGIDTVYIPLSSFRVASEYYNRVYGGYSTHALPTRNAERLGEAQKERNVPKYVKEKAEYFEKDKGYEPSYAWAMAWSIWCKYKNPESPHCKREQKSKYLINQGLRGKDKKPYPR
jgi:hypothetical protein